MVLSSIAQYYLSTSSQLTQHYPYSLCVYALCMRCVFVRSFRSLGQLTTHSDGLDAAGEAIDPPISLRRSYSANSLSTLFSPVAIAQAVSAQCPSSTGAAERDLSTDSNKDV